MSESLWEKFSGGRLRFLGMNGGRSFLDNVQSQSHVGSGQASMIPSR
jgi:hypothetical protein